MLLSGRKLAVSVPDTVLEDKESWRDKTAKLGTIARACSIYGVDVIEIFNDPRGKGEAGPMRKVLEYLDTPQYLRKRLFPLDDVLRYAGALPPLRIPSHKAMVPLDKIRAGEVRDGVVNVDGTVEAGLEKPVALRGKGVPGSRITLKITSTDPLEGERLEREAVKGYWGFRVETKGPSQVLSDEGYETIIATSKFGDSLGKRWGEVGSKVGASHSVKLVFGSPSRGLYDIFGNELVRKADFVLNVIPEQNVETVRTEEAVFACLELLSIVSLKKA
jgi:methyltransferase